MKRLCLLAFLVLSSCHNQSRESVLDLTTFIRFAETKADTEVLLFATTKADSFLTSWSEPRRQSGGRFRWSMGERAALSWTLALPSPAFLHVRFAAIESFPMELRFNGLSPVRRHSIDRNKSFDVIPLPERTTGVEFRLPPKTSLGMHSAVITPSRVVAEFRKPKEFPYLEQLHLQGKKRTGLVCETGGSISFYEVVSPETDLEFGYYFVPSMDQPRDTATFSILLTEQGGSERKIFQHKTSQTEFRMVRLPLGNKKPSPSKLEFRIARDSAFGKGKTAWIQPRLNAPTAQKEKPAAIEEALRGSMVDANVLFIILDAASVRRFGAYGYNRNTTPVFDAIAKEGVLFERAYTNAVYTLASSASILTGQLPGRHGVLHHRNKLPPGAVTLPETLQASGLETAAFLANGNVSQAFGLTQGFRTLREVFRDKNYIGRAEDITATFNEWLRSHHNRRFFAYLHYREPHDPYQPPVEWVKRFSDPSYAGPVLRNFQERIPIEKNDASLTQKDREFISALYDANLAYGDFQVGEVLRSLKQKRLYDKTMIILTSDHGEAFWEHGYQGHNLQLYEESAQVPLVIKFPKGAGLNGRKVGFPVQHVDFYPTMIKLLGFSLRGVSTDGFSFASWLTGSPPINREIIIHSTKKSLNGLVIDDYKYIRNLDQSDELYNLKKDPLERNNLFTTEKIRAGYLRQILLRRLEAGSRHPVKTESVDLDDAARENLKALGYID